LVAWAEGKADASKFRNIRVQSLFCNGGLSTHTTHHSNTILNDVQFGPDIR